MDKFIDLGPYNSVEYANYYQNIKPDEIKQIHISTKEFNTNVNMFIKRKNVGLISVSLGQIMVYPWLTLLSPNLVSCLAREIGLKLDLLNDIDIISSDIKLEGLNRLNMETQGATYLLSLKSKDQNEIAKGFPQGLKKNVRRTENLDGIEVKLIQKENEAVNAVEVINQARSLNKLQLIDTNEYLNHVLTPNKCRKDFALYLENEILAVQGIYFSKIGAVEVGLGISPQAYKKKIYAGDYLKWEIINWCLDQNLNYYDFAGVSSNPLNDKEKGIRNYKAKWGGSYVEYSNYTFYNSWIKSKIYSEWKKHRDKIS